MTVITTDKIFTSLTPLTELRIGTDSTKVTVTVVKASVTNPIGNCISVWGGSKAILLSEVLATGAGKEFKGKDQYGRCGLFVADGDIEIFGGVYSDNGIQENLDHGIYISKGSGKIIGAECSRNKAAGIQLYPSVESIVIDGCQINDNGFAGILIGGSISGGIDITRCNFKGNKRWNIDATWAKGSEIRVWEDNVFHDYDMGNITGATIKKMSGIGPTLVDPCDSLKKQILQICNLKLAAGTKVQRIREIVKQ